MVYGQMEALVEEIHLSLYKDLCSWCLQILSAGLVLKIDRWEVLERSELSHS